VHIGGISAHLRHGETKVIRLKIGPIVALGVTIWPATVWL
jgi:hypothetical protein